jgi:serine/threonine protein kinase
MGVVYKARQLGLNRLVALKMIRANLLAHPEALARFRTEARAVAQLDHPNIVRVYDSGESGGQPYVALEFLPGGSLAQARERFAAPRAAATLVAELAEAVEYAHRQGIIHRDLKPANVLLAADGTAKITDFGLARQAQGGAGLTQPKEPLGSPAYMAPEQAQGRMGDIGPATDVYGLGAILYELLTGRAPHGEGLPEEALGRARTGEVTPPRALNPAVPRALERGEMEVLVTVPGGAERKWVHLQAEPWQALPVRSGELVHVKARFNQPAHAFLLYLTGQGEVLPLYPWNDNDEGKLRVKSLAGELPPLSAVREVDSPRRWPMGWQLEGPGGLETVLLLARRTPLPAGLRLGALVEGLPAARAGGHELVERVLLDGRPAPELGRDEHRGLAEQAREVDGPLDRLMGRLGKHFELVRAVRFAYAGK